MASILYFVCGGQYPTFLGDKRGPGRPSDGWPETDRNTDLQPTHSMKLLHPSMYDTEWPRLRTVTDTRGHSCTGSEWPQLKTVTDAKWPFRCLDTHWWYIQGYTKVVISLDKYGPLLSNTCSMLTCCFWKASVGGRMGLKWGEGRKFPTFCPARHHARSWRAWLPLALS